MKKVSKILAVALCVCALSKAKAQTWNVGYPDSTDVTATLSNGTLTISGTGEMQGFAHPDYAPWYSSRNLITNFVIDSGVTNIGDYAFISCSSLTSVTIPNSVTTIGEAAFSDCQFVTSVSIPHSITTIGLAAFSDCWRLISIDVDASNSNFSSLNGVLFNKLQDTLICCPAGKTGSYTIPNSVTAIGNCAFFGCSDLNSITVPDSVTTIGHNAFRYCFNLRTITIPDRVTTIEYFAFSYCSSLISVNIPQSVTTIGDAAFLECGGLRSIIIPDLVTTIGSHTFESCYNLSSVTIGSSVTMVGYAAFSDCQSLTSIYLKPLTPPLVGNYAFDYVSNTIPVYVPCGKEATYQNWGGFSNIMEHVSTLDVLLSANDPNMGEAVVKEVVSCNDNSAVVEAIAYIGYRFVKWNDDSTANPRTITVTQDTSFVAEFEQYMFNVTLNVNNSVMGAVTGTGTYEKDSTAIIEAIANQGYHFLRWHDGDTINPRTITVTQDTAFTAFFEADNSIVGALRATPLQVYPNPARDNITISLPDQTTNAVFTLYDLQGRTLLNRTINNGETVSVDGLSAGMYVYSLLMEGKRRQGKLSIVR